VRGRDIAGTAFLEKDRQVRRVFHCAPIPPNGHWQAVCCTVMDRRMKNSEVDGQDAVEQLLVVYYEREQYEQRVDCQYVEWQREQQQ